MTEKIIHKVTMAMAESLTPEQLKRLENILTKELADVEIKERETALVIPMETWERVLQEYFISMKVEGRSDSTIDQYKRTLVKFFIFAGKPVREISTRDIRLFLFSYEEKGCSKSYIDTIRRELSAFFCWSTAEGFSTVNPTSKIKKIKSPEVIRKPLTRAEREALNDACETSRDQALLATLYSTACRVGEIISIDRDDVDFISRTIKVYGSKGKAERVVCINDTCYFYLRKYLAERTDDNPALFVTQKNPHRRISKECIQHTLKNIGERAGVNDVHPHRFRRTMLTDMSNVSIPVQHIMKYAGHKEVGTTMNYIASSQKTIHADFEHYMINT